ncbi:DNA-directed RNA polymerase III subunit RPC3 [Diprion similis]|uniref:DNA-directed RNA polymerase III subunit RPC3 n=1 Tax=Diprion similis TaxID=362088 RepID=UPI001EF75FC7|nr:DNA-directed RNA polymerase III subunit RPC3 [Diprion similis]
MSIYLCKLCSVLLLEHFGPVVQIVGEDLLKYDRRSLGAIKAAVNLPLNKVKEVMCVLIKYGFVEHRQNDKLNEYIILHERILMILRYPRYMFFVKSLLGDEAEIMLEELLRRGYETASKIIVKTYQRLKQLSSDRQQPVETLKEKFELLVKHQFLMRSIITPVAVEDTADLTAEKLDISFPDLNFLALSRMANGTAANPGDNNIYWRINFDRFTQDIRDQIMVSAISKRFDDNAGELMRQMLNLMYLRTAEWRTTSNPIPYVEIKDAVRKLKYPMLIQHLDQYLCLIEEDTCQFLKRVGDSGGGQFSINMKQAFTQLTWTTLENIVLERFGSKAARIFRLVRTRKYVEQEQIQQLAMIPAKEAKHLTYTLLQENYIHVQELKKTTVSNAPTKIFFLFHIDLDQVVGMEISHCYHALYNTIQRRDHENTVNKRMIEKHLRVQTLTSNLKEHGATEEQLNDIAEMMTPSEKLELGKVQDIIKKLGASELQIDDTLFLLTMYLRYQEK